jgi:hypothetical protein
MPHMHMHPACTTGPEAQATTKHTPPRPSLPVIKSDSIPWLGVCPAVTRSFGVAYLVNDLVQVDRVRCGWQATQTAGSKEGGGSQ